MGGSSSLSLWDEEDSVECWTRSVCLEERRIGQSEKRSEGALRVLSSTRGSDDRVKLRVRTYSPIPNTLCMTIMICNTWIGFM